MPIDSLCKSAYSGDANHWFRREADHPVRSSRSPVGAKRRGGSIMPISDRLESMKLSSFRIDPPYEFELVGVVNETV